MFKEFEIIWRKYAYHLPINEYQFEKFMKMINKIRSNNYNFEKQYKNIFIDLINLILEYCDNNELNCCNDIEQYLSSLL
jgi:hypothetical protein